MRDLARELRVSVVTVSNALNNRGSMAPATRRRILDTAMARGYRRDEFASLNAARRHQVPSRHLVAFNARSFVEHESSDFGLYRTICFRLMRVLGQHGCDVVLTDADAAECAADLAKASAVIHIDAIPESVGDALLAAPAERLNVALFFEHPRCVSVMPDNDQAGRLAAEFLAKRGHRHVAVHASTIGYDQRARFEAFTRHFKALVPRARLDNAWPGPAASWDAGFEACFGAAAKPRPTALFSVAGYGALLANKYFHSKHLVIPRDIGLLGFDNFPFYDLLPVPITRFHFDAAAMGDAVADAVVTGLSRESFSPVKILVPIRFRAGDSVLPVREMKPAVEHGRSRRQGKQ
jgi:DNA-binding LacI/PurR family transcriptional regulator